MSDILIAANLRIGLHGDDQFFREQQLLAMKQLLKNASKKATLIFNGDTFAKSNVTAQMAKTFHDVMLMIDQSEVDYVIFSIGLHDAKSKREIDLNAVRTITGFAAAGTDQFEFGSLTCEICEQPGVYHHDRIKFGVVPYAAGDFEQAKLASADFIISYEDRELPGDAEHFYGNLPSKGESGFQYTGTVSQYSNEVVFNDRMFYGIDVTGDSFEATKYVLDLPAVNEVIEIKEGHVDGSPAVSWISSKRKYLKQVKSIRVVVDSTTDSKLIEQFTSILSTINSNFEIDDHRESLKTDASIADQGTGAARKAFIEVLPEDVRDLAAEIYNDVVKG